MSTAMASLVLALLVLPSATTAAVATARRNCSDTCGDSAKIPYPFGLGPSCSLPGFSLTCADNRSDALLGNQTIFIPIAGDNYLLATISYSLKMIPGVRDYSLHWEAPARPFAISGLSSMSFFIVGCGVKATLFVGNSTVEVGNCSVVCAEARIMEKLPKGVCDGIGCCFIDIQVNLKAFTLNISRTGDFVHSNKVYAFIGLGGQDQIFLPIDALRSMLPEYLEIEYATIMEWAIPYQPNCTRAMKDRASYACAANHSECEDSEIGGYFCACRWGVDGNPYVHGGCPKYQPPPAVYGSIQPRKDCPRFCGHVSIPFPFGATPGCFATEQFYLKCHLAMPGTVLPVLELNGSLVISYISTPSVPKYLSF